MYLRIPLPVIRIRLLHRWRWYCLSATGTRDRLPPFALALLHFRRIWRPVKPEAAHKECTAGDNPPVSRCKHSAGHRRHPGLPVCHETKGRGSLIPRTTFRLFGSATRPASWGVGECTTRGIRKGGRRTGATAITTAERDWKCFLWKDSVLPNKIMYLCGEFKKMSCNEQNKRGFERKEYQPNRIG